jgi:CoA:oxalate CoA-transferase
MSFERPYAGLKVVDMSQGVAGPYCAMLLARHGASVTKIEPLDGDWARTLGARYGDNTAFSVAANTGKRSIAVDLKSDKGREIVDRMMPTADVFLEGFRPGVTERLGFGYERLRSMNPGLVYVSISGFGQVGPLSSKPAMDPILQAFSGFMAENKGPDGVPHRTPVIVVDMSTALYAHQAVVAALYARKDGAPGRRINVSLMEAVANITSVRLMANHRDGPFKSAAPPGGTYKTKDGWMQIGVVRDHEFQKFCKLTGLKGLAEDPRFAKTTNRYGYVDELSQPTAEVLATRTSAEWRDLFTEAGLQNEVVQTYPEFITHPQSEALELFCHSVQPGSDEPWPVPNPPGTPKPKPGTPEATAPANGQHTRQILTELGYSAADISRLIEAKVVGI